MADAEVGQPGSEALGVVGGRVKHDVLGLDVEVQEFVALERHEHAAARLEQLGDLRRGNDALAAEELAEKRVFEVRVDHCD